MTVRILIGDVRDELAKLPSDSVDLAVYLQARGGECEANARLCAAAPDMHAIIAAALPVLRQYLEGDLNSGCLTVNGVPNRATLQSDFQPLVSACEALITDCERVLGEGA